MIRALVVGGREDFVRDRIGANLRKVGIEVAWHYDFEHQAKAKSGIPKDCELVVLLSDMTPGAMAQTLAQAARSGGYPLVRTHRKWAVMLTDLMKAGVIKNPLSAAGEQLLHNVEALESKGLMEKKPMATPLPVRVATEDRRQPKTFEELLEDLKVSATALMLAHDVTSIIVTSDGIDVKQTRSVKVAL